MTIVKVSKKKIIKAIKTEPLKAGSWINTDEVGDWFAVRNLVVKDCSVCAVGSVMRNILNEKATADDIVKASVTSTKSCFVWSNNLEYANKYIKTKNYMAALSCFFETIWTHYKHPKKSITTIRNRVVRFVELNFPTYIEIDINGTNPAKDVEVIG